MGDVHASDEEHNPHRARQKKQCGPSLARHLIMQQPGREEDSRAGSDIGWRCLPSFQAGIEIRELTLELRRERLELGVPLIERDAGPEPRRDRDAAELARRRDVRREPYVDLLRVPEKQTKPGSHTTCNLNVKIVD